MLGVVSCCAARFVVLCVLWRAVVRCCGDVLRSDYVGCVLRVVTCCGVIVHVLVVWQVVL